MTQPTSSALARIQDIARDRPREPALIGFDADLRPQVVDWPGFAAQVARTARRLAGAVPRPGPVIAVEASNDPAAVVAMFGVLCAGHPLLPVNPRSPAAERDRLYRFVAAHYGPVAELAGGPGAAPRPVLAGQQPAAPGGAVAYLLPTGGSSGRLTVTAQAGPFGYLPSRVPSPFLRYLGWQAGQRQLVAGPIHHAGPFITLIDGVLDANTLVLQPVFSPAWTVRLIETYAVEWTQLTPAHLRAILQVARPDPEQVRSLRAVVHTAAPCDELTKRGWIDLVGPHRVYEYYGSTEQIGTTVVRGDQWLARPHTVGKGLFTQIRILDEAGRRLPPGEVGRVFMRCPRQARGRSYLDGYQLDATVDGFFSVGDYGWLDDDGYLFLAPRRLDMINVGGENVYAEEVEAVVREHPQVRDAAATGMADPQLGAVLRLYVVPVRPGSPSVAELSAYCRAHLAGHQVPRRIDLVDAVPRSSAGKLERWRLAQPAASGAGPAARHGQPDDTGSGE